MYICMYYTCIYYHSINARYLRRYVRTKVYNSSTSLERSSHASDVPALVLHSDSGLQASLRVDNFQRTRSFRTVSCGEMLNAAPNRETHVCFYFICSLTIQIRLETRERLTPAKESRVERDLLDLPYRSSHGSLPTHRSLPTAAKSLTVMMREHWT